MRRIQPAGAPALYELRVGDNHHHLVCRRCGAVHDVDCAVGAAPCLEPAERLGFEVDEAEVVYLGHLLRLPGYTRGGPRRRPMTPPLERSSRHLRDNEEKP